MVGELSLHNVDVLKYFELCFFPFCIKNVSSFFFFCLKDLFIFLYMCVLHACMCTMFVPDAFGSQKKMSDALEPECR